MKQLIRLEEVELYNVISTQSPNGDFIKTESLIDTYEVIKESLTDSISATVYGANLNKMVRFSSVNKKLENFLFTKWNNTSDNISKYLIKYDGNYYKINSLTARYVDGERL